MLNPGVLEHRLSRRKRLAANKALESDADRTSITTEAALITKITVVAVVGASVIQIDDLLPFMGIRFNKRPPSIRIDLGIVQGGEFRGDVYL